MRNLNFAFDRIDMALKALCFQLVYQNKKSVAFLGFPFLIFLFLFNLLVAEGKVDFPKPVSLGDDQFDFGGILIDRRKAKISFDAVCNQTSGLVEYALVHKNGKVHESLFRTEMSPRWIHACLVLIKARPFDLESLHGKKHLLASQDLAEHEVRAYVSWESNASSSLVPIHSFVYNQISDRNLDERPFVFTGSKTLEGVYLADVDGSILAIFNDIRSTINSFDKDSNSDDSWVALTDALPPLETKVRFHLQVPSKVVSEK